MQITSDRDKVAHLLRRFGLGASEAELEYYVPKGVAGTIDALLNADGADGFGVDPSRFAQPNNKVVNMRGAEAWWVSRLLITQRPLVEKLTLFWHDHFATSAEKVDAAVPMIAQNEKIRTFALGRFEDLLLAMSKDPAMIYWLDNQLNKKGKPNENFAREVMELFTLGIGHYTEKDVQEAARAFTGWGYGRRANGRQIAQESRIPRGGVTYVFDPQQHDDGAKALLGNKGNFTGEDVIGILSGQPQTATHLAEKMWEFFAYEGPDEKLVSRLADKYRNNGLRTSVLVRAIMESPEFYSEKCVRRLYKNPVDFCIATLRSLGIGNHLKSALSQDLDEQQQRGVLAVTGQVASSMKAMGMQLFYPPDVAGWDWGEAWISTSTMVERMKWADKVFGQRSIFRQPLYRGPLMEAIAGFDTPEAFTKNLCSLFDVPVVPSKLSALSEVAKKGNLQRDPMGVATNVSRLIFCLPEFQFA